MERSAGRDQVSDEKIIELYWNRDESAITETEKKYAGVLYRIAFNILSDRQDSEECCNDTYLGVWNAIPPARPAVFPAFLTRIARRIAINRYRARSRHCRVASQLTVSLDELGDTLEALDPGLDAARLGRLISDYLSGLDKRQRYIFVSRYYMCEPVERIAEELRLTVSAVYKALAVIKRGLKDYLERNGESL